MLIATASQDVLWPFGQEFWLFGVYKSQKTVAKKAAKTDNTVTKKVQTSTLGQKNHKNRQIILKKF